MQLDDYLKLGNRFSSNNMEMAQFLIYLKYCIFTLILKKIV